MVVDKMHMKGHTDPWCKEHCDPSKFQALDKVSLTSQSASSIYQSYYITHLIHRWTLKYASKCSLGSLDIQK